MKTEAKVICDHISHLGKRLTTLEVTFPRFILPEFTRHRVFSLSFASSRAIPPERHVDKKTVFTPEFGSRVKGMSEGELHPFTQRAAKQLWDTAAERSFAVAHALSLLGVDKSHINRLLEPFIYTTGLVTATEWDNFFALRIHEAAQKEFRELAECMKRAMDDSEPELVKYGDWALPLVTKEEVDYYPNLEFLKKVSAGRCARISYDKAHETESPERSAQRADMLLECGHLSPCEHQGTPLPNPVQVSGNFIGWTQYRQTIPNQENFALANRS